MTDVPPPVPPEIVEQAATALATCDYHRRFTDDEACDSPTPRQIEDARYTLAAVYGDIVEAARRDVLTEAVDAIEAADTERYEESRAFLVPYIAGLVAAARIVTDLRDATAPRTAPAASDEEIR